MIQSPAFWEDIGRFPLPLEQSGQVEMLENKKLSPAFLSYWPDSWIEDENCLSKVEGLRQIEEGFLNDLVSESSLSHDEWQTFFSQAGVSAAPKVLKYSRVIGGDEELLCEDGKLDEFVIKGFRGERQTDMNSIVVEVLRAEQLWSSTVASVAPCSHNVSKVIQNLTLLEGFSQITRKAMEESQSGGDAWKHRLWTLIKQLPLSLLSDGGTDAVFCRGGGGHSLDVGSYLERQLNHYAWLPSSLGPATSSDCFLRLSTRYLISSGTSGDELGDKLLPYVVVDNIDEQARLQNLGVQVLDDADSASIPTLTKALTIIGNRLSTEWGQGEILKSPGRWRLVRGAIQEIYRRLNQYQGALDCSPDTKFATRSPEGTRFLTTAMYYADPGSAVERAFMGMIPLFDADRPYPQLFEQISVTRLQTTGERKTVEENLLA
ncbi:hypothetical protein KA005_29505, partial [bacterium]|nr:hypothetical protein [bacterium]